MDRFALGQRVAQAREDAGVTQDSLGRAVGLDRSAISRLEKGDRKIDVPEMVQIAKALERPLAFFVSDPVQAVVSRRNDSAHSHGSTRKLDAELDHFALDIQALLRRNLLPTPDRLQLSVPQDHSAAESAASLARTKASLGIDPIEDLGKACETLGLYIHSSSLGDHGADGGCVEVDGPTTTVGAAVLNGDMPAGRRRMTLAHELGHWLFGDAYDLEASSQTEKMINSFAIHFLAPRAGVTKVWNAYSSWKVRDRALAIGAIYRLSWSAAVSQLRNLHFISFDDHRVLGDYEPTSGDYLRLGLIWSDEFSESYFSPILTASILNAYVAEQLTAARAIELLRGTLSYADLPQRSAGSLEDLRGQFVGHDR